MFLSQVLVSILFYHYGSATDYAGEKFPDRYLEVEEYKPTLTDLDFYLHNLAKTTGFFASDANDTEINKNLGMAFSRALLKRTLVDDGHKLTKEQRTLLKIIINEAETVVSHHAYDDQFVREEDMTFQTFRVSRFLKEHDVLAYAPQRFHQGRLQPWLKIKSYLHEYIEEMDDITLPRAKYVELIDDSYVNYYIRIEDSDMCLSKVVFNLSPVPGGTEMRPCSHDPFCYKNTHTSPSISYGLSHRMLNIWVYRAYRHCYWVSPHADLQHLDNLCAAMYREAVYIARRGFFARDLFLEHIALCAFLGYKEFHRPQWFRKVASWIDNEGCIQENLNTEINRTAGFIQTETDQEEIERLRAGLKERKVNTCHIHPMALLAIVLSHAIRYTAYLLPNS
ncbi:hypothetical protein NE865_00172 [Phthorimaea operculella]|nr:hypothetical protein NE865_00172 [Phthorimaea operculella]